MLEKHGGVGAMVEALGVGQKRHLGTMQGDAPPGTPMGQLLGQHRDDDLLKAHGAVVGLQAKQKQALGMVGGVGCITTIYATTHNTTFRLVGCVLMHPRWATHVALVDVPKGTRDGNDFAKLPMLVVGVGAWQMAKSAFLGARPPPTKNPFPLPFFFFFRPPFAKLGWFAAKVPIGT